MNENTKRWLKKIGVVGFLFFLLKGIVWLVFGAAIFNWLKSLFVGTILLIVPCILFAQAHPLTLHEISNFGTFYWQRDQQKFWIKELYPKPFFCRLEDQLNDNKKTTLKFRLGSLEYSNEMEYSKYFLRKDKESIFLR